MTYEADEHDPTNPRRYALDGLPLVREDTKRAFILNFKREDEFTLPEVEKEAVMADGNYLAAVVRAYQNSMDREGKDLRIAANAYVLMGVRYGAALGRSLLSQATEDNSMSILEDEGKRGKLTSLEEMIRALNSRLPGESRIYVPTLRKFKAKFCELEEKYFNLLQSNPNTASPDQPGLEIEDVKPSHVSEPSVSVMSALHQAYGAAHACEHPGDILRALNVLRESIQARGLPRSERGLLENITLTSGVTPREFEDASGI